MKFTLRRVAILAALSVFLICLPGLIYAQVESSDCPDIVDPDYPCPIDSWLIVLLCAGVVYGLVKIRATKSPKRDSNKEQNPKYILQ